MSALNWHLQRETLLSLFFSQRDTWLWWWCVSRRCFLKNQKVAQHKRKSLLPAQASTFSFNTGSSQHFLFLPFRHYTPRLITSIHINFKYSFLIGSLWQITVKLVFTHYLYRSMYMHRLPIVRIGIFCAYYCTTRLRTKKIIIPLPRMNN